MNEQLDVRKIIAQQIGELILANFEQAAEIQRLRNTLAEVQKEASKDE